MTKQEAKKEVRNLVKQSVSKFLKENDNELNWELYGLAIVKKEIFHAYKRYWVSYCNGDFVVMGLGNNILAR